MSSALRFSKYLDGKARGRALVSYLKDPAWEELKGIETTQFSNNGAGRMWPKVLNKLGYLVDVINWDDTEFAPTQSYDVIIVHGGKNFKKLLPALKPDGKLIYYSTGSYWRFHNEQEEARFADFAKRNNYELTRDRYIGDDEEAANHRADAIISLGNAATAQTYKDFENVYHLEGANYPGTPDVVRDMSVARNHFLFLSGPGNIHKGLDLALEAFRQAPDLHLHIMGVINDDFAKFYHKDLYESPNIHTYGYVPQRSTLFYAAIRQCAFSLLLSCSEGSPGSVIESMQQGLIPVVSQNSHISLPPAGVTLKNVMVTSVHQEIMRCSNLAPAKLQTASKQTRQYAARTFSLNRFERDLKKILVDIISKS